MIEATEMVWHLLYQNGISKEFSPIGNKGKTTYLGYPQSNSEIKGKHFTGEHQNWEKQSPLSSIDSTPTQQQNFAWRCNPMPSINTLLPQSHGEAHITVSNTWSHIRDQHSMKTIAQSNITSNKGLIFSSFVVGNKQCSRKQPSHGNPLPKSKMGQP